MDIAFTKMHGTGNDFIVVDEWDEERIPEGRKPEFVKKACDRHFGIGSDGAIFAQKSKTHDANFVFYNPDGSRAEMCGNGIRCLAKYLYEHCKLRKRKIDVETMAGIKTIELTIEADKATEEKVDMGRPQVLRGEAQVAGKPDETFINQHVRIADEEFDITSVGMGNPHAIVFVRDVEKADVRRNGALIRNHTILFPSGTNAHFVQKVAENEFKIRTFERGVEDETLACGTGICASAVAAVLNGKADIFKQILFHARGGDIRVQLEGSMGDIGRAYLIGGAEETFQGNYAF
ncbi:MAG: diaminopimelate epimerase [Candidatus Altiarchaeota archaeon]